MFERKFTDGELALNVKMYPDDNLHYVELQICYAEIERQRALISTAIEHIKEHEQCYATPNRMTQWLKDVERGGDE